MKPRTLSFDDGFFPEFKGRVLVVGVVMRGKETVENVVAGTVEVDGLDSTHVLSRLTKKCPQELNAVLVNGIALGGFNVVDLKKLSQETGLPVVSVTNNKPHSKDLKKALREHPGAREKLEKIEAAGPLEKHEKVFFHAQGITLEKTRKLLDAASVHSLPEGIRLAHLIASGITRSCPECLKK
jgi:hypothetical protein